MSWLVRAASIVVGVLLPLLGTADDPTAGGGEVAVQVAPEEGVDVAPEEIRPLSPLHPRAGTWDGFVAPTFEGSWRTRIALNAWLPNELPVTIDANGEERSVTLTLGWIFNNLEYYYPPQVEIRKGSFGVFANTLFWKFKGSESVLDGRRTASFEDQGYWIDTGLSYELASWRLTDEPRGPAVTLEPYAAARLVKDPVGVTLPFGRETLTEFDSTVPIIGLRSFWDLGEHWNIRVEADYGGFGVDDNKRTWKAQALFGYRWRGWGTSWNLQVGYLATTLFKLKRDGVTVRQEARGPDVVFSVEF